MSDLLHRLETYARQREARGASEDELKLYRDVIHALTPHPKPMQAARETLALIQQHPGINPSRIAELRDVTQRASHNTVIVLERRGFIRTELQRCPGKPTIRACYPVTP